MLRLSLVALALLTIGCRPRATTTSTVTPVPASPRVVEPTSGPAPTLVQLALETGWGCGLRSDGSVHCWGQGDPGAIVGLRAAQPRWEVAEVLEGFDAVDISSSPDRLCAVERAGSVRCLDSQDRRLSDEAFETIVDVEVGDFVCTRSSAGAVHCTEPKHPGVHSLLENEDAIDLGVEATQGCALEASGTVECWLMKLHENKDRPAEPKWALRVSQAHEKTQLPGVTAFESFGIDWVEPSFCFARERTIWCAIESRDQPEAAPKLEPMPGLEDVLTFTGTPADNCAIHATGELTCAGDNRWAQVGDGTSVTKPGRFEVEGISNPAVVAKSASYTCAATGTDVQCWGTQLGDPDDASVDEEHHLDLHATGLAVDGNLGCVSTQSKALLCWGMTAELEYAVYGQFPRDAEGILGIARPMPVQLDIGPLKTMQGGCLLDQAGELVCGHLGERAHRSETVGSGAFEVEYRAHGITDFFQAREGSCWIRRGSLECFDHFGANPARHIPKRRRSVAVAGRGAFACVLDEGGEVSCFVLFPIDGQRQATFVPVAGLTDVVALVAVGNAEVAALDARGKVWQWGFRLHEPASGPAAKTLAIRDLRVQSENVDEIAGSPHSSCIRRGDRVSCEQAPAGRDGFSAIVGLAAGHDFFCVRHDDGSVTCRGNNRYGQLGVPPATVMLRPTPIEFVP